MAKTNIGLVAYAESKLHVPTMYMLGGIGRLLTNAMVDARIAKGDQHTKRNELIIRSGVGKAYAYDCNALMKCYLWEQSLGVIKYDSKSDLGSTSLYNLSKRKGKMASMPDLLGLLVWTADLGHVGVYVGKKNGVRQYIEATPAWNAWGVTTSADKDHPEGHNRTWTFWGEYHLIDYIKEQPKPDPKPLKVGDKVKWSGFVYRDSMGGGRGRKYPLRNGTITIFNKNPYGVHIDKLGWIAPSQIEGQQPVETTFKVGDVVQIKQTAQRYVTGQLIPKKIKDRHRHTIMEITKDKKRILLREIYSWVYAEDITK